MKILMYEFQDTLLSEKIKYCHDIVKTLDFLHESNTVHYDIKLENILICIISFLNFVAKLSDFDSALLNITADTSLIHEIVKTQS